MQMTDREAEAYLNSMSRITPNRAARKRALVADRERLARWIVGDDPTLATVAMEEAQRRSEVALIPRLAARRADPHDRALSTLAAATLAELGPDAHDALRAAVDDRRPSVRQAAAPGLGRLLDPAAIPALREALDVTWPDRRIAAAALLARLGDRKSARRIRDLVDAVSSADARHLCDPLGRLGDRATLHRMLKSASYAGTRAHAARALGVYGDRSDAAALIVALSDRSGMVRLDAAQALARRGDARAIPALERASREPAPDASNAGFTDRQARKAAADAAEALRRRT